MWQRVMLCTAGVLLCLALSGAAYVMAKWNKIDTQEIKAEDLIINEEVKMNDLTVISNNGNLEIKAKFSVIYVRTVRGDVNIATNADDDIFVVLSSKTGNISVELSNIKHINLSLDTRTGRIRCRHREKVGYDADISASTVTGNIKIK